MVEHFDGGTVHRLRVALEGVDLERLWHRRHCGDEHRAVVVQHVALAVGRQLDRPIPVAARERVSHLASRGGRRRGTDGGDAGRWFGSRTTGGAPGVLGDRVPVAHVPAFAVADRRDLDRLVHRREVAFGRWHEGVLGHRVGDVLEVGLAVDRPQVGARLVMPARQRHDGDAIGHRLGARLQVGHGQCVAGDVVEVDVAGGRRSGVVKAAHLGDRRGDELAIVRRERLDRPEQVVLLERVDHLLDGRRRRRAAGRRGAHQAHSGEAAGENGRCRPDGDEPAT